MRRRSDYAHFVFLDSRGHPWLLQSCPQGPSSGPLGVLTACLDDPSRVAHLVPSRSHRVLYVITLGALTASLDDPSRSLPGPPGALSGHSEATLVPNWCTMASPTGPSEVT